MNRDKTNRYQYQPWYIKLWRRRHYIPIPFVAASIYLASERARMKSVLLSADEDWVPLSWRNSWSIAIGLAQVKMNWLHDWSEIRDRLDQRIVKEDQDETP